MTMITLKGKTILVADTNVQDFPSPERLVRFQNPVLELQDFLDLTQNSFLISPTFKTNF